MSANVSVRHSGKVAIIDVAGRVCLPDGLGVMRRAIKETIDAGGRNILLNLAGVSFMDSAGLGEMASSYITVTNLGGKMSLLQPPERLNSMLHVTKLYTLLVTYPSESEALASFG